MLTVEEWTALRLSLQVAVCATLAGMPFAIAAGYVLARWKIPGKWLFETALNLPLVLPPVVVGYLLLTAFAPRGPLGAALFSWFGLKIVFTWLGAAVASAVMSFPLAVRAMPPGLPGGRSTAGNGRPQPRGQPLASLSDREPAVGTARSDRRRRFGLRPQPRRVRRHDHGGR